MHEIGANSASKRGCCRGNQVLWVFNTSGAWQFWCPLPLGNSKSTKWRFAKCLAAFRQCSLAGTGRGRVLESLCLSRWITRSNQVGRFNIRRNCSIQWFWCSDKSWFCACLEAIRWAWQIASNFTKSHCVGSFSTYADRWDGFAAMWIKSKWI